MNEQPLSHNQTSKLPQLNWTGWLVVGAVAVVVISIILRIITPPQSSVALPQTTSSRQNMDGSASIISNVVYQGPELEVANELPVVVADISEQAATNLADYLISQYDLTPNPELPNIWVSQNYMLSKDINSYEYLLTNLSGEFQTQYISLATAQEVVNEILNSYPALSGISLIENKTKFLEMNQAHSDEVSPNRANAIALEYSWKIEGIPLYLPKRYQGGFVAYISADKTPIRLSFPLVIPEIGDQVSMNKTLTINQAIDQLNQSNGSVIYAEQADFKPFDISAISSAQLKSVNLEYRIDPELKLAIPYYRFSGVIKNSSGSIYNAQLLTPAVATTPVE